MLKDVLRSRPNVKREIDVRGLMKKRETAVVIKYEGPSFHWESSVYSYMSH
jgi:hypothetical protein